MTSKASSALIIIAQPHGVSKGKKQFFFVVVVLLRCEIFYTLF